jgi:hypothetical protein
MRSTLATETPPRSARSVAGPRRELKIFVEGQDLDWAERLIRLHPAGFRATYPPRWINSIYFDSPSLDNYEDNVAGIGNRRKTRIRWYGELEGGAPPQLEIKVRKNGLGWKIRYLLDELDPIARQDWDSVGATLDRVVASRDALIVKEDRHAILANRYRRVYYRSADGRCDLTLDGGFRFFDQRYATRPNLTRAVPCDRGMVIELKFAPGLEPEVSRISPAFRTA